MTASDKQYKCRRCGCVVTQTTNHYGPTWSWGHFNCCPDCPPWAKYPEFGGSTHWDCLDRDPQYPQTIEPSQPTSEQVQP